MRQLWTTRLVLAVGGILVLASLVFAVIRT